MEGRRGQVEMSQPESLVSSFLYAILGFVLVAAVGGPASLGLFSTGAILLGALVVAGVDAAIGRLGFSPIRTLARVIAASEEDRDANVGV